MIHPIELHILANTSLDGNLYDVDLYNKLIKYTYFAIKVLLTYSYILIQEQNN